MTGAEIVRMIGHALVPGGIEGRSSGLGNGLVIPVNALHLHHTASDHEELNQEGREGRNNPQEYGIIPTVWISCLRFQIHYPQRVPYDRLHQYT
jgi:hypothetical protein